MFNKIKSLVPLWLKTTVSVLIREIGRWPFGILWVHIKRTYIESKECSETYRCRVWQQVQKQTLKYLDSRYSKIINERLELKKTKYSEAPIWVFWWQGEEQAPLIVKKCIESIRFNAGTHPIFVVDKFNYRDFITLPEFVEEKREKGIISLTHFSDIVRMALLAEHGGLWLDSTIYVTRSLEEILQKEFFTVRNPGNEPENVSKWEWSVFAIGGHAGRELYGKVCRLLCSYWQNNDYLIDYYLFDYMVRMVVESDTKYYEMINAVPANNPDLYFYQKNFNGSANISVPTETWMFKLSWKGSYSLTTDDGEETLYGKWARETEQRNG